MLFTLFSFRKIDYSLECELHCEQLEQSDKNDSEEYGSFYSAINFWMALIRGKRQVSKCFVIFIVYFMEMRCSLQPIVRCNIYVFCGTFCAMRANGMNNEPTNKTTEHNAMQLNAIYQILHQYQTAECNQFITTIKSNDTMLGSMYRSQPWVLK